MPYNTIAHTYADSKGIDPADKNRVYFAVLHGLTLVGLKRKEIGCPVVNAAYNYSIGFTSLNTEEKFRVQQAVIYGHSLINTEAPMENTPDVFTDTSIMPFGKFKGKQMANVPAHYLIWLMNEGCSHSGVKQYILDNLDGLKQEAKRSQVKH